MKNLTIYDFSGYVAILQLDDTIECDRMESYIRSLEKNTIVLLGEYVVDSFFSDNWILESEPRLKAKNKLDIFAKLSKKYGHIFVIPFIKYKNKGYYKQIAVITKDSFSTYNQQRLIQYSHWNESSFFSNDVTKLPKLPLTFTADGVKFGVLFGFEAHFDEFWMEFKRACVDVVLVPTASTFSSNDRWQRLLTTHSFTNSCYVFRANRIGQYISRDGKSWNFYGNSFVSFGQDIIDSLLHEEGMLCVEIDKLALESIKKEWGFRN